MSLIAQYNPLRFYADKRSRQFENTNNGNRCVVYPIYLDVETKMATIPNFSLILDTNPNTSSIEIRILDCDNKVIHTTDFLVGVTIINKTTYFQLVYAGGSFEHDDEGFYQIEIDIDSKTYYSDMFYYTESTDELFKIHAESSKIRLGEYEYEMLYNIHKFYVNLKPLTSNTYLKEEANETYAITNTNYGSSALLRSYNVLANEPMFMFLRGLRILQANGSIVFTHKFIDYQASDIVTEIESDVVNADLINVKIEFKVLAESVSVYNG